MGAIPIPAAPSAPVDASPVPGGELTTDQLMTAAENDYPGMTEPGNIDLTNRPHVQNPDGTTSTIRSLGVNIDGQETLIPTVSEDGRIMTDDEAIEQYKKTGRHLGKFDSVEASNNAAQRLHEQQASGLLEPAKSGETAPKTPAEAAAQNAEDIKNAGAEKVAATEEKTKLDTQQAEERARFEQAKSEALTKIQTQQELHRQAAEAHVADVRAHAENEPYHTHWDSRSVGEKVAIAFGLIVGGVSWNENHVNRGVEMLNSAMKENDEIQKQKHAQLWKAVENAEQGVKDLDTNQLRELSAFNASEGAKWDAIASRLGAMIAANKGKGDTAEAKKQASEANEKANQYWQNSVTAAATAQHLKQQDEERARHDLENEKLRGKKIAQGSGGVSITLQSNGVTLRENIEAAQKGEEVKDSKGNVINPGGKPLTGAQIDRRALELRIPPVAKAGKQSVKTILDNIKETGAIGKGEISLGEKDANLILYDAQTKEPYGKAHNARETAALSKQDVQYGDAARRVSELAQDIKEHGATVTKPEDIQRRAARYANAIIGVAVTSPLGKTNESIHQEAASLGLSGAIDPDHLAASITKLLSGFTARPETVEHKAMEMRRLRQEFRNTVPITEDEKKKFARGGNITAAAHPDRELKGGGIAKWNATRGGYERSD